MWQSCMAAAGMVVALKVCEGCWVMLVGAGGKATVVSEVDGLLCGRKYGNTGECLGGQKVVGWWVIRRKSSSWQRELFRRARISV
jgi:hypothetical protein